LTAFLNIYNRWVVALFSLVLLGGGLFFATKVVSDNSLDTYFDRSDSAYTSYIEYLDEFVSD
jgi:predicted RND superfamily exporter protein